MGAVLRRCPGLLAAVVTGAVLLAGQAGAVTVRIIDDYYELEVQPAGKSFRDLETAIRGTPWWSTGTGTAGRSNASTFAAKFLEATNHEAAGYAIFFAYNMEDSGYRNVIISGTRAYEVNRRFSPDATSDVEYGNFRFATLMQTVPEIDGPVLARATMALGVLWLSVVARRRRTAAAAAPPPGLSPRP